MSGPPEIADRVIVFRVGVRVLDDHRDRSAGGDGASGAVVLEYTREDTNLVGFVARCDMAACPGTPAVQPGLNVGFRQGNSGRAAVDHDSQSRAVAFAPGRDAKKMTKGVV